MIRDDDWRVGLTLDGVLNRLRSELCQRLGILKWVHRPWHDYFIRTNLYDGTRRPISDTKGE
jgi:hypothetical protein